MPFDISNIKEKLTDEEYSSLASYVEDVSGQLEKQKARAKAAQAEKGGSADQLAKQAADLELALERLGVASVEEIDASSAPATKPDDASASEIKLKRLTRKMEEVERLASERAEKLSGLQKELAIREMLAGQSNLAPDAADLVREYFSSRLVDDGGEWCVKSFDGSLVTQEEGFSEFIEKHPSLVRSASQGGSGFSQKSAAKQETKPFSEMTTGEKTELYLADQAAYNIAKNLDQG